MLPRGRFRAPGVETSPGLSRPANTVGGDFYDILPLGDGRLVIAVGRRRRQGQPGGAADGAAARDDAHAGRRAPRAGRADGSGSTCRCAGTRRARGSSRCSTRVFDPAHRRADVRQRRPHAAAAPARRTAASSGCIDGGIALGMFEASTYQAGRVTLAPSDLLAIYSDGITEAENPEGRPFDERGLEDGAARRTAEQRRGDRRRPWSARSSATRPTSRFADDFTLLLLRRSTAPVASRCLIDRGRRRHLPAALAICACLVCRAPPARGAGAHGSCRPARSRRRTAPAVRLEPIVQPGDLRRLPGSGVGRRRTAARAHRLRPVGNLRRAPRAPSSRSAIAIPLGSSLARRRLPPRSWTCSSSSGPRARVATWRLDIRTRTTTGELADPRRSSV